MAKHDVRKELVEAIQNELENGHLPVEEGWLRSQPYNVATGKQYQGVNRLWLSWLSRNKGWDDNRFCTYKQAEAKGAQVKKGAKATQVEYFRFYDIKNKKCVDKTQWEQLDPDDQGMLKRYSNVFNGSMIEGLGEAAEGGADLDDGEVLEICGALADGLEDDGFVLKEADDLSVDGVVLSYPKPEAFNNAALFISEFSKLAALALCKNEEIKGSEDVAAQIAAAFFTQSMGAEYEIDPKYHASRILGWKRSIQDKTFFKAVKEGQKLADRLLELVA